MLLFDENYQFERPANIRINFDEQINLGSLLYPLEIDDNIAFLVVDNKIQLGKIKSFNDETATIVIFLKETTTNGNFFKLSEHNECKTVLRSTIIKTGIQFTKKFTLKKTTLKQLRAYIVI